MTSEPTAESFAERDRFNVLRISGEPSMADAVRYGDAQSVWGSIASDLHVRFWNAVNAFAEATPLSVKRQKAVSSIEEIVVEVVRSNTAPEPTYTMQQAIDKIVDGLVLEWVASPITDYCRAVTVIGKYYTYADRWIDIFDNEFPCESMDHAKELCLRDYKSRFRSGIEKAVKL